MPFDPESLLLEIHAEVCKQRETLSRLVHRLDGNGKPGMFDEFIRLKESHDACQREKAAVKAEAERQADRDLRRSVAVASVIATLIATLINKLF
jgi:hypothetical protein